MAIINNKNVYTYLGGRVMFHWDLIQFVASVPGLLLAITIHEYAHALMAVKMGDMTPKFAGRLTLNPFAHLSVTGTIFLLLLQFGWAKGVPVDGRNFKNYYKGEILVSLAGPFANFLFAFIALAIDIFLMSRVSFSMPALEMVLQLIVLYNINFGFFNLLPIPPLDGSHILWCILPGQYRRKYFFILEKYALLIFLVILATPILGYILIPAQQGILHFYMFLLTPLL